MVSHKLALRWAKDIVKRDSFSKVDGRDLTLAKAYLELSPLHWQNTEAKEATKRRKENGTLFRKTTT